MGLQEIRKEYTKLGLSRADLNPSPISFFELWFEQALEAGVNEPNAMVLSTINQDGAPDSRIVLLKGIVDDSFHFFTNYESQKGQEIAAHPEVSLLFFWPELERQVRIRGNCSKLSRSKSEAYFSSRPRQSQLGAWASDQSQPIENRQILEDKLQALTSKWEDQEIPCPDHWGGYAVNPKQIEFWQGRVGRLHDRFRYSQNKGSWNIIRLAP